MFSGLMMLCFLPFAVFAGLSGVVADVAVKLDPDAIHIKVPKPWSAKLFSKISKEPVKTIKSYRANSFFMNDFAVRLSEEFKSAHVDGIPLQSYEKAKLATEIEHAPIELPRDLHNWRYGTSRILQTSEPVKLTERFRSSKLGSWTNPVQKEEILELKATRYKGEKLPDGKRGKDIVLIEELVSYAKPRPIFKKGALSGVVIEENPVIYGDVKTWKVPTVFTHSIDIEIRGTKRFINNHILGNVESDFSQPYLFVFPKNENIELRDTTVTPLEFGVPGQVRTDKVMTRGFKKDMTTGEWKPTPIKSAQVFTAVKYQKRSGPPVLVLTGWHSYIYE